MQWVAKKSILTHTTRQVAVHAVTQLRSYFSVSEVSLPLAKRINLSTEQTYQSSFTYHSAVSPTYIFIYIIYYYIYYIIYIL